MQEDKGIDRHGRNYIAYLPNQVPWNVMWEGLSWQVLLALQERSVHKGMYCVLCLCNVWTLEFRTRPQLDAIRSCRDTALSCVGMGISYCHLASCYYILLCCSFRRPAIKDEARNNKVKPSYNYHNFGHHPSFCLLFKNSTFRSVNSVSSSGVTYSDGPNRKILYCSILLH
jgi:hypothetical protein